MDKARQAPLALGLDGHDEAPVALGDERLLQHLGIRRRGDDALENLAALRRRDAHLAADVGKLRAGRVGDRLLVEDGAADAVLEILVRVQGGEIVVEHRGLALPVAVIFADAARSREQPRNIEQLARVEHAAVVGARQRRGDILHAGKGGASVKPETRTGGVRLVEQAAHLVQVAARIELSAALARRLADGLLRQHLQHGGQLERADGFVV